VELARNAAAYIGTLGVFLLFRWAIQHHTPDANDAEFLWLFIPLFIVFDWWRLTRARRATPPRSPTAN
jgi:hypothetical protein